MRVLRVFGRRVYRNRRHFVLQASLLFLAGVIGGALPPGGTGTLPGALYAGILVLGTIGPILAATCLVFPVLRGVADSGAVGVLALVLLGAARGEPVFGATESSHVISLLLIMSCALWLANATALDRVLPRRKSHTWSALTRTPLPADLLFDGLIGTPERPDRLVNDNYRLFEQISLDPRTHRLVIRVDDVATCEERHVFAHYDPPHGARLDWEIVGAAPDLYYRTGTLALRIDDLSGRRYVQRRKTVAAMPLRQVWLAWLDDLPGRTLDAEIEVLEARGARMDPQAPAPAPA